MTRRRPNPKVRQARTADLPEPFRTIVEGVVQRDAQYFRDHPGVHAYERPYVQGEAWPQMPTGIQMVQVFRTEQGNARVFYGQQDGAPTP